MSAKRPSRKLPAWMAEQVQGGHVGHSEHEKPSIFAFPGVIKYCPTIDDVGLACEALISRANEANELLVALDAEWPVTSKGPGKVALIQVCCDADSCYLFHISCMNNLPRIFHNLIHHPKVKIVGQNVKNDIWKIGKDYSIHVAKLVGSGRVIDLGELANRVLNCAQIWSLDRLASHLLSVTVDKTDLVRRSRWDLELSDEQQLYAATDAYVSLVIYNKLKEKSLESQNLQK